MIASRPVNEPSRAELWQTRLGSFKEKNNRAELETPGSSSAQLALCRARARDRDRVSSFFEPSRALD